MDKKLTWLEIAVLVLLLLACMGISCLYAHFTYGDWTCGLPSVECRKVMR